MTQITKKLKISDFLQSLKKLKNLNFFSSTAFLLYNLLIILLLITINQSQFFFNKKNHYTVNFDISLHEDYFFKVNHLINVDINEAVKKIIYQDTIIDKIYVKKHLDHYNQDYRFSYEIIAQSYYLNLKISSVPTKCDYTEGHTTMPLRRAIPCIIHALKIGLHYRLAKLGLKFSIFKI